MELVSATRKAIDSGPGAADPAVREAAEVLAVLLSLFAPYTAEESWQLLGHKPSVARATWPVADQALLTQEKVTCVVQVNGKVRDKLEVSPQIGEDELRELALVAPGVVRTLGEAAGEPGHRAGAEAGQHRRGVAPAPEGPRAPPGIRRGPRPRTRPGSAPRSDSPVLPVVPIR